MIKIALCDDNQTFLKELEQVLKLWDLPQFHFQIQCFSDGDTLIQSHIKDPFDIIFLDVIMPMFNGIDTAAELRASDPSVKIIFLSVSPEYAVDSYTVKANNYLLKPVDPKLLYQCLHELVQETKRSAPCITVKVASATYRILLEEIEFIEAQNKRVCFTLTDGRTILANEQLYTYEKQLQLSDGFFRCHRSYIVNIYHVSMYTSKEITMCSGFQIPISRRCQKSFEEAYFSTVFKKTNT